MPKLSISLSQMQKFIILKNKWSQKISNRFNKNEQLIFRKEKY